MKWMVRVSPSVFLGSGLLLITGCTSVGPDYVPPEVEVSDSWYSGEAGMMASDQQMPAAWWDLMSDPVLSALIQRAHDNNLDVKQAVASIEQSRALLGVSRGQYMPDLNGSASATRGRTSEDYGISAVSGKRVENAYSGGLDASWEMDFWGRIRRSVEASEADLSASVEAYRDVLVVLYSDVGVNYVQYRTLQARLNYAESNVLIQRKTLELTKDRVEAEISPELDIHQAQLNLSRTEATIPTLKTSMANALNRLSVLIGESPGMLAAELADRKPIPDISEEVLLSVPANMIRQRPDIRQAERSLAAETARVGVAKADLYPSFSLSGTFAYQGSHSRNLFERRRESWSIGPAFSWNLFDGGRVRSQIEAQDALVEQALYAYEEQVLEALEEVENALEGYAQETIRKNALSVSVREADKSVELVDDLYRNGLVGFRDLLDAQRDLFQQQDDFAASEGLRIQQLVLLYKAMGGGWRAELESDGFETEGAER